MFCLLLAGKVSGQIIYPNMDEVCKVVDCSVLYKKVEHPILSEIKRCESRNRQFDEKGNVLRGIVNPKDIGLYQINERWHLATSQKMGIDIYTVEGNTKYAEYLYEKEGTKPWNSSRPCWGKLSGTST